MRWGGGGREAKTPGALKGPVILGWPKSSFGFSCNISWPFFCPAQYHLYCFPAAAAELNSCDRDHMATKPEIFSEEVGSLLLQ